jgi:hypothetical protein
MVEGMSNLTSTIRFTRRRFRRTPGRTDPTLDHAQRIAHGRDVAYVRWRVLGGSLSELATVGLSPNVIRISLVKPLGHDGELTGTSGETSQGVPTNFACAMKVPRGNLFAKGARISNANRHKAISGQKFTWADSRR